MKINRFERKWIYKSTNHLNLINSLIRSELYFNTHHPQRYINSIYFDTPKFASIRQNLDGISNKKKIRIRWYGDQSLIIKPILEIKSKRGSETKKELFQLKKLNGMKFPNQDNLSFISELVNSIIKPKNIIYPILTTHYERQYFISLVGNVRATVDYNLKSIYLKNFNQLDIVKNFSNLVVLEIKYSTKLDKFVRNNLKNITMRLSKNSKFVKSAIERPIFFS